MVEVGAFEAKNRLSELLKLVEAGESVVITKHGHPVACLSPIAARKPTDEAIRELRDLRQHMRLKGLTIQELREEGRRF